MQVNGATVELTQAGYGVQQTGFAAAAMPDDTGHFARTQFQ